MKMKIPKKRLTKFLKEASVPLALMLLYLLFVLIGSFVPFPDQSKIIEALLNFVNEQSLLIIFAIALIEGALILGQYAPGGTIIFLSILSAEGDLVRVASLVLVISAAFLLAYSFDYLIGYYGINTLARKFKLQKHIEKYKRRLESNELLTIFFTYWETNIASLVAAAAGSLRVSFKRFFWYSFAFVLFWNIFWAVMLVLFGGLVLEVFGYRYLLIIVLIWIAVIFYRNFIKKEEPALP